MFRYAEWVNSITCYATEKKGYNDIVVIRLLDDFLGKINLNKYQNISNQKYIYSHISCLNSNLN